MKYKNYGKFLKWGYERDGESGENGERGESVKMEKMGKREGRDGEEMRKRWEKKW
jgi:hypothetical protein